MRTQPQPPRGSKLLALVLAISFLSLQALSAAPKLDALRAAQIATTFLKTLGPDAPYIESISLEVSAVVKGEQSWVVHWSKSFPNGEHTIIGLRVKMDGSIAQLSSNKEARRRRTITRPR
jgi:hypothetical protein